MTVFSIAKPISLVQRSLACDGHLIVSLIPLEFASSILALTWLSGSSAGRGTLYITSNQGSVQKLYNLIVRMLRIECIPPRSTPTECWKVAEGGRKPFIDHVLD